MVCQGRCQEHLQPQLPQLPYPQWEGGYAGPWPPAWWHPNIDGHHRFTRGILRGRGKGCSQETRGKPELKGESKTKGVKAKRAELELNGSMRIGQRSTKQEKEGSLQRSGVQAPWEGQGPGWEGEPGALGGPGLPPSHPPRREHPQPQLLNVLPSPTLHLLALALTGSTGRLEPLWAGASQAQAGVPLGAPRGQGWGLANPRRPPAQ